MASLSDLFDDDFLADIAANAPVESAGLEREFKGKIVNAFFQEAGAEYQKTVKPNKEGKIEKVLQIVFDIENPDWDKGRQDKYSIGTGWKLDGGDGKTAPRVVPTGTDKDGKPYSKFSSQSNYGRLYRDLTEKWELTEENTPDCTFEFGDEQIVISPAGQRFFAYLKSQGIRIDAKNAKIWEGVELQWSKEEYKDRAGKDKDRAFPSALLFPDDEEIQRLKDEKDGAKSSKKPPVKAAETKKPEKKPEPEKEEEPAEEESAEEEVASSGNSEDDDIIASLTALALENEPPDYNEWRKSALKMKGVLGAKRWVNWCVMKANFQALIDGKAKPPA